MSELRFQRRLAAELLKCSEKRIHFDPEALEQAREAITKDSVRGLISTGVITKKPAKGVSRGRARQKARQKAKGRQRGPGSLKGKRGARLTKKKAWTNRVRVQRSLLRELRDKGYLEPGAYRMVAAKVKGGYFRSRRHIKLFIDEQKLAAKAAPKAAPKPAPSRSTSGTS